MPVYLDFNASAPIRKVALDAMVEAWRDTPGNAASPHLFGQRALMRVEGARRTIAAALGAAPRDVIFTSGATEADNLAILGLARWGEAQGRRHIIASAIEHPAVLEPLRYLQRERGFEVDIVPPQPNGVVRAQDMLAHLREDTLLVTLMHANNETGALQPVQEIARALDGHPAYFHVDAAQSFTKDLSLQTLGADTVAVTAHKLGGPIGVGALVFTKKQRAPIQPIVFGGGQEGGLRSGTLPTPLIAGFGAAVEEALAHHEAEVAAMADTGKWLLEQFKPVEHRVFSQDAPRLPNTLYLHFPGVSSTVLTRMMSGTCSFASGSACSSLHWGASHVLLAMGVSQEDALCVVRLSWGAHTGRPDLSAMVDAIREMRGEDMGG
nr:cysteine desulfurase family protein [bacterium]